VRGKRKPNGTHPFDIRFDTQMILVGSHIIIKDVPKRTSFTIKNLIKGAVLDFQLEGYESRHIVRLGELTGIKHFTCCHRYEPYWMLPKSGISGAEVDIETQFFLAETMDGNFVIIVPFCDPLFRASLQGGSSNELELVIESGDRAVVTDHAACLYIAGGDDPYNLVSEGAMSLSQYMGSGRLRREKMLPALMDRFGWCTWDAFYHSVSHDLIHEGLKSFAAGGIIPKFLILDDGWQSVGRMPSGEDRLTSFEANQKFPGGLINTVNMAKEEFGLETFLVWHAIAGYWGGVDGEQLKGYNVRSVSRNFSPGMQHYNEAINHGWWGNVVGVIPPDSIHRFYHDYHRYLHSQGVDGVKVDNQSSLEGLSSGWGGRVKMMRIYHEALEGSAHVHFRGTLINCMSNGNDVHYQTLNSNLMRTSTDFWPNRPESHGLHMYTNAQVGLWFGEFIHPDWDMFQSGHEMGVYHAMGRAVSGGPVYVSDKPDGHNFDVLRRLVLPDGGILRARLPGRPTKDCLFVDPTKEDVLLKIFNHNNDAGVIGIFNTRYEPDEESGLNPIRGYIAPNDIVGLHGEQFVVYRFSTGEIQVLQPDERWELELNQLTSDIFTVVPFTDGVAPIGLANYYNSSAAVLAKGWIDDDLYLLDVLGGGEFWLFADQPPREIFVNGNSRDWIFNSENKIVTMDLKDVDEADIKLYY
jgi:raffinose synthase